MIEQASGMHRHSCPPSNPQVPMASQMLMLHISNSDLIAAMASRQGIVKSPLLSEGARVTESGSSGEAPGKGVAVF